jgi:hypothetical protein
MPRLGIFGTNYCPTFMSEGDASTKFFHLQACHRGCRNVIDQLHHLATMVVVTPQLLWAKRLLLLTAP